MEIALIHNNSLELGPIGFNVKYINADLEDFISTLEDYYSDLDEIGEFYFLDDEEKYDSSDDEDHH